MAMQVHGQYKNRNGEWIGWIPLATYPNGVQKHNWGGVQFEIKFTPDDHDHQWLLLRDEVAWCPTCNEVRKPPD